MIQVTIAPMIWVLKILFAFLVASLAQRQGRSPYLWFGLGLFFGMFGLFPLFFIPPKGRKGGRRSAGKAPLRRKSPRRAALAEAPLRIQGPVDKHWYYVDEANAQQGPMSFHAFCKAFREKRVLPSSYVWHEELADWKPLQELISASS